LDLMDTDAWDSGWEKAAGPVIRWGGDAMEGVSLMRMARAGDYKGLVDKIQQDTEEKLPKVRERLSRWGENIKGVVGRATDWIKNAWSNGWNSISSFSSNVFGRIGDSARDKFNSLVDFMRGIPDRIKGVFAS